MSLEDLKLHRHYDVFFFGVNRSGPTTSSTTRHRFCRILGRFHGLWCKQTAPLNPVFKLRFWDFNPARMPMQYLEPDEMKAASQRNAYLRNPARWRRGWKSLHITIKKRHILLILGACCSSSTPPGSVSTSCLNDWRFLAHVQVDDEWLAALKNIKRGGLHDYLGNWDSEAGATRMYPPESSCILLCRHSNLHVNLSLVKIEWIVSSNLWSKSLVPACHQWGQLWGINRIFQSSIGCLRAATFSPQLDFISTRLVFVMSCPVLSCYNDFMQV